MSALGGIFYFDGRPVSRATIATLSTACEIYASDGGSEIAPSSGVALVHRRSQITPEDHFDRQPVKLENGSWLVWDGRLDNRPDLMMAFGMRPSSATPDAAVVAEACVRWADDAYQRLIGDWSLVIWNPERRAVTFARDFMGIRPLYYTVTDEYCAWCTALEALVEVNGAQQAFDDDYLQARLVRCTLPGRTAYRGILPLLPGHSLTVSSPSTGRQRPRQFWHLPEQQLRHRDPRDYQEHLRSILRQAIADRMRSDRPVWMELSGGWDSSSVVCLAARLAEEGVVRRDGLTTLSYQTPTAPESDETRFITAVEVFTGLQAFHVPLNHAEPPAFPIPVHFRTVHTGSLRAFERMRDLGARTLLTGCLGDATMGNFSLDVTPITQSLRRLHPLDLLKELRAAGLATRLTAWHLLRRAARELMPQRMQTRADYKYAVANLHRVGRSGEAVLKRHPFKPASLAALRSAHEQFGAWTRAQSRPWTSRTFVSSLAINVLTQVLTSPPEGLEVIQTHPLVDRRLVEFIAAIDWSIVCRPGHSRALMRSTLSELLPPIIARRFSKGYAGAFGSRRAHVAALSLTQQFDTLEVVKRGYVDPVLLRATLDMAAAGASVSSMNLLRISWLEAWFRLAAAPARSLVNAN